MPSIHFTKTGTQHYPSTGNLVILKYRFHAEGLSEGALSISAADSTLMFNDRTLIISREINGFMGGSRYIVMENKTSVGSINGNGWPTLLLAGGEKFKLRKMGGSFWDSFKRPKSYHMQLKSEHTTIEYLFKHEYHEEEIGRVLHMNIFEGKIETHTGDVLAPLLGLFLVELAIEAENDSN